MPIVENSFTCPNGHHFTANAKVRARCPSCGAQTKRDFSVASVVTKEPVPKPEPVKEPKKVAKGPRLLKQGNPNRPPRVRRPKSLADTIREARDNAKEAKVPQKATSGKKRVGQPIAGGLVKRRKVASAVTPQVKRKPPKTAVSKATQYGAGKTSDGPYWTKVAAKFGIGR